MSGKRLFDLSIALPVLVLASPVILVAMAAIRLGSPGGAIFAQPRLGRDRRPFRCLKLRTMYVDTPSVPTHEVGGDAITFAGRFLRRFKIDELPQLLNVLRGEMSLVGPRPGLPTQNQLAEERAKRGVFAMLPGITGLAQIRGVDMSDPAACAGVDAEYGEKQSRTLDLHIIIATVLPWFRAGLR